MRRNFILFFTLIFYLPIFSKNCVEPLLGWADFAHDLRHLSVCDQGKYPHCSVYALKTFLDTWTLLQHHYKEPSNELMNGIPKVDPSYLALAFNTLVGKGTHGHNLPYLTYSLSKYGAVEKGSVPLKKPSIAWPFPRWKNFHDTRFLQESNFETLFRSFFRSPRPIAPITTPSTFLSNTLKFFPKDFRWIRVNDSPYQMKQSSLQEERQAYRDANHWATLTEKASQDGYLLSTAYSGRKLLSHLLEKQLEAHIPVLFSIIGDTQKAFKTYEKIQVNDLLDPSEKDLYPHALTAIALCRTNNLKNPLCQNFSKWIQKQKEPCVIVQNSYGKKNHLQGRFCITTSALSEIIFEAWIHRSITLQESATQLICPSPYFVDSEYGL